MTGLILSTICAAALNAAPMSAPADTVTNFVIDNVRVENFDGSQLIGKTIASYQITREEIQGVPLIFHIIMTSEFMEKAAAASEGKQNIITFNEFPGVPQAPTIVVRSNGSMPDPVNAIYIIDDKVASEEEFKNLDPKNISSISIAKYASSVGILRDLKAQGKYDGEIEGVGAIVVTTKQKKK